MSSAAAHTPVLLNEVLNLLALRPGMRVIDATIDGGGHTAAILERIGASGRLLGLDRDPGLAARARERFAAEVAAERAAVVAASFRRLGEVAPVHGFEAVDAVLFDLGLSSFHLDRGGRGFSFARDEPLDMRFDPTDPTAAPAAEILASRDAGELARLFRDLGEERFAARIARAVVAEREREPIESTRRFFEIIRAALPGGERQRADRSAARLFQALRIEANGELEAVREALPQAVALLRPGGRLAVISFHSLEDRLVKRFLLDGQREKSLAVLTKRPVRPSDAEIAANSRAASAKLRLAERRGAHRVGLEEAERVLRYWMGEDFSRAGAEERAALWFERSAATDNYVRERFGALVEAAAGGELGHWAETPRGRLALVILLDQFSRNLHRDSPRAFAADGEALRLCLEGIDGGADAPLNPLERSMLAMPMEHSERLDVQERSVAYFAALRDQADAEIRPVFENFYRFALQHRDVIARFGRFPHRNRILGRASTPEEEAFLRQPGSRF